MEIEFEMYCIIIIEEFWEWAANVLLFPDGTLDIITISTNDKIGGKLGLFGLYLHILN